jgi:DNA-binding phage protein
MTRKTGNYDEYHLEWLKNPENSAAFLSAVIEDNDREAFLLALRDVAQALSGRDS